jgi:hypothetical protein
MEGIFLQLSDRNIIDQIKASDEYVKTHCPSNQPYLYTAKGEPVIFKNQVGFTLNEA